MKNFLVEPRYPSLHTAEKWSLDVESESIYAIVYVLFIS